MIATSARCCDTASLCNRCVDDADRQLCGVAQARGHAWATAVRRRTAPHRAATPWPAFDASARVRALAHAKVADLTADPRLQARLARWCVVGAVTAWRAPARPTPISFRVSRRNAVELSRATPEER